MKRALFLAALGTTFCYAPVMAQSVTPRTVDFLYNQIVKAEASPNPALLNGLIAATLQSPDVIKEVRMQAQIGNAHAEDVLATCYVNGWGGLSQDNAQAMTWYKKAADQGDEDAKHNLHLLMTSGKLAAATPPPAPGFHPLTVDAIYKQIIATEASPHPNWVALRNQLQNADLMAQVQSQAKLGNAHAQDVLGNCYEGGWGGLSQDLAQAASWFRKAADQGDADAQYNLGVMYANGQGVPQDYAQAASWFRKAADQGYAAAQNNLGIMYANGQGVPQ
ncbi:MAG: tetratricopeptide repeat protein, partial [Pseudomonadota bacterium]